MNEEEQRISSAEAGSLSEWIDREFISNTPELTGLLYDLNLLPEQAEKGTEDEHRLYVLTRYFKENVENNHAIETENKQ
jgi:hypothetical protein